MTTSTASSNATNLPAGPGTFLLPWTSRGLEGLWLLTVLLVPLAFLGQEYVISEAQVAYVEVPKVALLRLLAAMMALLWLAEWTITSRAFEGPLPRFSIDAKSLGSKLNPSKAAPALFSWLSVHPTRWLLFAAALFFGSTLLSTVLSGSFETSMWGEIPGQDGYSAYTVASYGVLFAVIATRLRSKAQFGRLLGAVVLMGVLAGAYGILQHYGHDFLNVTEPTGGGVERVTIFMGNTIFAGAVLSMTIPVTLMAAALHFHRDDWGDWGPLSRLGQVGRDSLFTSLWASVLTIQLLALMFTFSRGPWGGAVLALAAFLALIAISLGWTMLVRTGLVLGLAGILAVAFLHWQGNVSVVDVGAWLGLVFALLGVAGTWATLLVIRKIGRASVLIAVVGIAVTVIGIAVIAPSALSGRGTDVSAANAGSTASDIGSRISSIKTDVLGGFVGGRGTHWAVSWDLIKSRPWFEFDDLSLSWLRPLIGYGPDLFRFTYLLKSPSDDFGFLPLEPDHAHNFFIHQTVEQGYIGGIASLALFASVIGVAGYYIFRNRLAGDPLYRLLLLGLSAVIFGRFLEMMVGVARVSDLTLLWVLFGLFAALARFDDRQPESPISEPGPPTNPANRRERRRAARASVARSISTGLIIRMAVLAWVVGGIGVVTWQKGINPVRAAVAEGQALEYFHSGDLDAAVIELDKAIRLAPSIPSYYNNRAQVFLNYQLRPDLFTEPGCERQKDVSYLACLGIESLRSNLDSIDRQPFYYRSRIAAGNAAFNLRLHESAIEHYTVAVGLVPNAWRVRNDLAESMIDSGLYAEAITELEKSLAITGDSESSNVASFLKGRALRGLGRIDDAMQTLMGGAVSSQDSLDLLRDIYTQEGVRTDTGFFDGIIEQNPTEAAAFYFRGLAYLAKGDPQRAILDLDESISLGMSLTEVRANRGYAYFKAGDTIRGFQDISAGLRANPDHALSNAYMGEMVLLSKRDIETGLNYLEKAIRLDPGLGIANLIRTKVLIALDSDESAKTILDASVGSELPLSRQYAERAEIHASFGEFDLAVADANEAIRINPNQAFSYGVRAKTYVMSNELKSAGVDFNTAISIDPLNTEYRIRAALLDARVELRLYDETLRSVAPPLGTIVDSPESIAVVSLNAGVLRELGLFDETVQAFKDAIAQNSDFGPSRSALELQGDGYRDQGVATDVAFFDRLIEQNSSDSSAHHYRGLARLFMGDFVGALADIKFDDSRSQLSGARATRGYVKFKAGQISEALKDLNAVLLKDSRNALANAYLGELLASSGEIEEALSLLENAVLLDPNIGVAHLIRAEVFVALGKEALAMAALHSSEGLDFPTAQHYVDRADLHASLGEFDLAVTGANEAIRIAPDQASPYSSRAKTYAMLNDFESAAADFKTAISIDPLNTEYRVRIALAEAKSGSGSYDEALRSLGPFISRSGGSQESIEALSLNATILKDLGLFDQTVQAFKNAISQNPDLGPVRSDLQLQGDGYWEQGVATDIEFFDRLIERNPSDASSYYFRGLARLFMGDAERAVSDFDEGQLSESRAIRGYAHFKATRVSESLNDLNSALINDPRDALANAYLGEFLTSRGPLEEGLRFLEKAVLLDPNIGVAHLVRAGIFVAMGNEASAKAALHSSDGLRLPTAQHYVDRADLHASFGEFDLAFSDLKEVIRLDPDRTAIYVERAESYAATSGSQPGLADFLASIP